MRRRDLARRSGTGAFREAGRRLGHWLRTAGRILRDSKILNFLAAALGVAAVTAVCAPFAGRLSITTVALALVLVVLVVATLWGSLPALLASVLATLAFDYYFLPPYGSFAIAAAQDVVAFVAFFITVLAIGELSARAKRRAAASEAARQQAEAASAYHRRLIEASLDPFVTIGPDGRISDLNAATEAVTGRSRDELLGTDFSDYFTDRAQARAAYQQAFQEGSVSDCPLEIVNSGGARTPVLYNASVYRDEGGEIVGLFAAARDISGLRRAETEIRHLASFPQLAPLPIVEVDRAMRVTFANPALQEVVRQSSLDDPLLFVPARWAWELSQETGPDADATEVQELQVGERFFEEQIFFSHEFQTLRIWAVDITARKQAERATQRLAHTLRTLTRANQALARAGNEPDLLRDMCRTLVEAGGYRMAWIGFAEPDPDKTVRVAAVAGHDNGYMEQARISWADNERGRGPTGTAIRTAQPQINPNFATDPRMGPWRDEAIKRGYASSVALPLEGPMGVFGALTIYSDQPDAFGADEISLLVELASDLSLGLEILRARNAQKQPGPETETRHGSAG